MKFNNVSTIHLSMVPEGELFRLEEGPDAGYYIKCVRMLGVSEDECTVFNIETNRVCNLVKTHHVVRVPAELNIGEVEK